MSSSVSHAPSPTRLDRLAATATLAGEALPRWCASEVALVGAGLLGSRLAREIVRSGARVLVCDLDVGRVENLGTQLVEVGEPKAAAVARACNALRPADAEPPARAFVGDVRRLGPAVLARASAIVDCTDDAGLGLYLTELSNGLRVPLVRVAVDGTGERQLARVLASHGGAGHACQLCSVERDELARSRPRTPCLGAAGRDGGASRPPTLAGNGIGMAAAGAALLQLQRLLGGNGGELVLDREVVLDLDGFHTLALTLPRSLDCVTGHRVWSPLPTGLSTRTAPFGRLFEIARTTLGTAEVELEPHAAPFCLERACAAGHRQHAVGTEAAPAPACPICGATTAWRPEPCWARWSAAQARHAGLLERSLASLGLPAGALVHARRADGVSVALLLDGESEPPRPPSELR